MRRRRSHSAAKPHNAAVAASPSLPSMKLKRLADQTSASAISAHDERPRRGAAVRSRPANAPAATQALPRSCTRGGARGRHAAPIVDAAKQSRSRATRPSRPGPSGTGEGDDERRTGMNPAQIASRRRAASADRAASDRSGRPAANGCRPSSAATASAGSRHGQKSSSSAGQGPAEVRSARGPGVRSGPPRRTGATAPVSTFRGNKNRRKPARKRAAGPSPGILHVFHGRS